MFQKTSHFPFFCQPAESPNNSNFSSLKNIENEGLISKTGRILEIIKNITFKVLNYSITAVSDFFLFHTFNNLSALGLALGFVFNKEIQKLADKINIVVKSCKTTTEKLALYGIVTFCTLNAFSTVVSGYTLYRSTLCGAYFYENRRKKYLEYKAANSNPNTLPSCQNTKLFENIQGLIQKVEKYFVEKMPSSFSKLAPLVLKIQNGLNAIKNIALKVLTKTLKIVFQAFLFYAQNPMAIIGLGIGFIFNKKVKRLAKKIDIVIKSFQTRWEKLGLYVGGALFLTYTLPTTIIGITLYRSMEWGMYIYQSRLQKVQNA